MGLQGAFWMIFIVAMLIIFVLQYYSKKANNDITLEKIMLNILIYMFWFGQLLAQCIFLFINAEFNKKKFEMVLGPINYPGGFFLSTIIISGLIIRDLIKTPRFLIERNSHFERYYIKNELCMFNKLYSCNERKIYSRAIVHMQKKKVDMMSDSF